MWEPRKVYRLAAVLMIGALLAAPARAAAPPVVEDDDPSAAFVDSPLGQVIVTLMTTALISPYQRFKHHPPPNRPRPLVVRPPTPPRPDDRVPNDGPPRLQEAPEPGTMVSALIGGGLSLMAAWRRRRRKAEPEEVASEG
jgi:hypothetical protein